jgi:hypothetical protein
MARPHFDPVLRTVALADLRPTQMTVGLIEVERRRAKWRGLEAGARHTFLASHMVPTVIGPNERRYIVDNHHLCRALIEEGEKGVFAMTVADLSKLEKARFWSFMDHKGWAHPYDDTGERRDFKDIPKTVSELTDDPYRSLAGAARRQGGFAKDSTPFSEFLWADFFRDHVKVPAIRQDFQSALAKALVLARTKDANYLPGWCGASGKDSSATDNGAIKVTQ